MSWKIFAPIKRYSSYHVGKKIQAPIPWWLKISAPSTESPTTPHTVCKFCVFLSIGHGKKYKNPIRHNDSFEHDYRACTQRKWMPLISRGMNVVESILKSIMIRIMMSGCWHVETRETRKKRFEISKVSGWQLVFILNTMKIVAICVSWL